MDLVTDFAYPLPATVIEELLGVPSEDQDIFRQWADNIVSLEVSIVILIPLERQIKLWLIWTIILVN